jgi:hypothetical protein
LSKEWLIYCTRPSGFSLWLPSELAIFLKIKWGDRLTMEQFEHHEIQGLIARRLVAQGQAKSRKK